MKVELAAQTVFYGVDVPWRPDVEANYIDDTIEVWPASHLVEFGGRACYQSWQRPNPATATNDGYIAHIIGVGHMSVLEHAHVSFYVTGVSRSFTHEHIRHRHFNYSQLSQRYVPLKGDLEDLFVEPDVIAEDPELHELFTALMQEVVPTYNRLKDGLERKFEGLPDGTAKKKAARQAARSVLPNAAETKILITGNYRSWWDMIVLRATPEADVEIREFAVTVLKQLQQVAEPIFKHFRIYTLDDGTEAAGLPIGL